MRRSRTSNLAVKSDISEIRGFWEFKRKMENKSMFICLFVYVWGVNDATVSGNFSYVLHGF